MLQHSDNKKKNMVRIGGEFMSDLVSHKKLYDFYVFWISKLIYKSSCETSCITPINSNAPENRTKPIFISFCGLEDCVILVIRTY
jgi:hypothetical protein